MIAADAIEGPRARHAALVHPLAACLALAAITAPGCSGCPGLSPRQRSQAGDGTSSQLSSGRVPAEVEALRPRYRRALDRARSWLDVLHVDPIELRRAGIKGKKKLVEQIDSYYRLWRVAAPAERPGLLARIRQITAVTHQDRYHDLLAISDRWFKQDATSYLRAALLMERMGLDTRRYRQEIRRVHGRLNAHMSQRGPHQRRVFHWYYDHFGLKEPFPLGTALAKGVIAGRRDPSSLDRFGVYDLTHEVYALYEFGDRLDIDPFDADAKQYLGQALELLISRYIERRDPDLVGELLECLHYLRLNHRPGYLDAVRFMLASQNADGSWGSYQRQRERLGDLVRQGYLLHTVLVAIGALTAVFDHPMPPAKRRGVDRQPDGGGPSSSIVPSGVLRCG